MKSINTLVEDIYGVLESGFKVNPETTKDFADKLSVRIANRVEEERTGPRLRLSTMSHPCDRKIWYEQNQPDQAEPLPPEAKLKFLYGDILEETLLFLAKAAGHDVQDEQKEVDLYGVKGHIDAIIDGSLVDVKSASTMSFGKFATGLTSRDDGFGYLGQGDSYLSASQSNPNLKDKGRFSFLAVDKQLGKLVLDTHEASGIDWRARVFAIQRTVEDPRPPPRAFSSVREGASGNQKLDTVCSYCPFKSVCWPGLRTFLYARGPVFLTRTERVPDVPELK